MGSTTLDTEEIGRTRDFDAEAILDANHWYEINAKVRFDEPTAVSINKIAKALASLGGQDNFVANVTVRDLEKRDVDLRTVAPDEWPIERKTDGPDA